MQFTHENLNLWIRMGGKVTFQGCKQKSRDEEIKKMKKKKHETKEELLDTTPHIKVTCTIYTCIQIFTIMDF